VRDGEPDIERPGSPQKVRREDVRLNLCIPPQNAEIERDSFDAREASQSSQLILVLIEEQDGLPDLSFQIGGIRVTDGNGEAGRGSPRAVPLAGRNWLPFLIDHIRLQRTAGQEFPDFEGLAMGPKNAAHRFLSPVAPAPLLDSKGLPVGFG